MKRFLPMFYSSNNVRSSSSRFTRSIKRFSKQLLVLVLILIVSSGVYLKYFSQSAAAAWYDENFAYRQGITVTISSNASEIKNLETLLTIDTSALISAGKLQNNCQDLRFTSNGGKALSYYIDSGCNTTTTKIWIMTDVIPANTTSYSLFMYYGNPSALAGTDSTKFTLFRGLVGYWGMNESAWNGTSGEVKDFSANGINGISTNGAVTTSSGKYSYAGSFDGIDDYIGFTTTPQNGSQTYSAWIKTSASGEQGITSFSNANPTNGTYDRSLRITSTNKIQFYITNSGASAQYRISSINTVNDGSWHQAVAVTDGATVSLYVDGVFQSSTTGSPVGYSSYSTPKFNIGNARNDAGGATTYFNGQIDDTRIYNRALSYNEIKQLYQNPGTIASYSSSNVTPTTSFATEEKAPQPVAVWSFDEGTGTTANDSTTNKNIGILTNMSSTPATNSGWMSEDMCISGKCLAFDGKDDRVNAGTNESLNITGAKTFELWFKETSTANVNQRLISKRQTTGGADTGGGNELTFNPSTGVLAYTHTGGNSASVTLTQFLNTWVHIAVSYDAATIRIYKNGILVASAAASQPSANSNPFMIGALANGLSPFSGFIDEVRMYPYTRSSAQIKADFATLGGNIGSPGVLGVASNNNMAALSSGLVGYWKMNEASWSGTVNEVLDSSGAGNNGASVNGAGISAGKFGNGGSMDGVDDYVNIPNNASWNNLSSVTYSLWIKPNSTTGTTGIMNARDGSTNGGYDLDNLNGTLRFSTRISGGGSLLVSGLVAGTWQHIVATYNNVTKEMRLYKDGVLIGSGIASTSSGNTAQPLKIGNLTNMSIDDVRVYNRALSSADVSTLYSFAPGPVGYWNLDEKSGTTASDVSGNGNNGIFTGTTSSIWANGKVGGAGQFNGTNNTIAIPDSSTTNFGTGDFTLETWVKTTAYPTSPGTYGGYIYKLTNSGGFTGYDLGVGTTGQLRFELGDTSGIVSTTFGSSAIVPLNTWTHVAVSVSRSSQATLYLNGVKVGTPITVSARTGSITNPAVITLSKDAVGGVSHQGLLDEVKIYNYARSAKQVNEDMNAGHPAVMGARTGSTVGYWDFDEGFGTTANDLSGNGNKGTLTNMNTAPSASTSGWSNNGKFNKALSFDGVNDYVDVGSGSSFDFTSVMTVEAWVYPTAASLTQTSSWILSSGTAIGTKYQFALANGAPYFFIRQTNGGQVAVLGSQSLNANTWYHLVGVADGSKIHVYANGKELANASYDGTLANPLNSSNKIGYGNISTRFFGGQLDQVNLYNYALTADDVKRDYNRGASQQFGSTGTTATGVNDNSSDRMYCPPGDSTGTCGPVGEWNFEEGQGSSLNDTSGNGNTGTWNGTGNAHYVAGKVGKGGGFDGSTDYVSVADDSSLNVSTNFTVSGWIKNINGVGTPVIYDSGTQANRWFFSLNGGRLNITERSIANNVGTTTLDNNWHHVAVVKNGDTGANVTFYLDGKPDGMASIGTVTTPSGSKNIGKWTENGLLYWNGGIDQLKVYNYARSTAQIAWDYNRGGPVAAWDMDECQGNVIHDLTGNGNDGAVTIGGSGSQTSLGTCTTSGTAWGNGATGKVNSSLNFDGGDDYVNLGTTQLIGGSNLANDFSTSFWMKAPSGASGRVIFSQGNSSIANTLFEIIPTTTNIAFNAKPDSGSIFQVSAADTTLLDNTWHHIVITRSGTNLFFYDNGIRLVSNTTFSPSGTFTYNTINIGRRAGAGALPFQGQLDELKLYNYALTTQQVKTLYTGGAVRFGPSVGNP